MVLKTPNKINPIIKNGKILKSGTSEFLANDEEAQRLYLGEKFRLD